MTGKLSKHVYAPVLRDKVKGLFLQGKNQEETASERSGPREPKRARARGFGERQGGGRSERKAQHQGRAARLAVGKRKRAERGRGVWSECGGARDREREHDRECGS